MRLELGETLEDLPDVAAVPVSPQVQAPPLQGHADAPVFHRRDIAMLLRMVDHIEVITDGASALYGADAAPVEASATE